ncbi:MAG: 4Fe-4S binding protein [Nitrospinota bacterium]
MSGARWGVFLCSCDDSLPLDVAEIQRLTGLPSPPRVHPRLSAEDLRSFAYQLKDESPDFFLVDCSAPPEVYEATVAEAGLDLGQVVRLELKKLAYGKSPGPAEANRVAARLIRGAMAWAEEDRGAPALTLRGGASLVVATDHPAGIALADRLAGRVRAALVVDEAHVLPEEHPSGDRPGEFVRGRVTEVRGHLGNFQVTVDGDGEKGRRSLSADQVVAIYAQGEVPRSGLHTGYHCLTPADAGQPDAVIARVLALVGEFSRPDYLRYDPDVCAAGRAEFHGCGVCLDACPHDALEREALHIRVNDLTCEGCGACVSACPTSAMRFLGPSETQIDNQVRALLQPLPGEDPGPLRPAIVFHCGEQGATALRAAGERGWTYGENLLPVEVPCLRFVSEAWMLRAFRLGAAGVALLGCAECPHGERPLLKAKLEFTRAILDTTGFGAERLALIPAADGVLEAAAWSLAAFGAALGPPPLSGPQVPRLDLTNREMIRDALEAFMDATGREPGKVVQDTPLTFGEVSVNAEGCTLCGACVFVCPTHALRMHEQTKPLVNEKTLQFNHLDCVACGMCAPACPEKVVTLVKGLTVDRNAFSHRPKARDEMVLCAKCGREYINKKALDAIEDRVLSIPQLADTFAGRRRDILRMCPECRAVVAVEEMHKGWEP